MAECDRKCPGCGISGSYLGSGSKGFCITIYCLRCHILLEVKEMLDVVLGKREEPAWLSQDLAKRRKLV